MSKLAEMSAVEGSGVRDTTALGLKDAIALIVGIVIGAGIFETPALVAANSSSGITMLLAWFLGGGISLVGALCYAELATAYPHVGGNYYYLKRAFGSSMAFLFSWARMTVLQTGSIALLAFVFGDYMSQLWPLGEASAAIYAAGAIALLSLVHLGGLGPSKHTQQWLTLATVIGVALVGLIGTLVLPTVSGAEPTASAATPAFGLAMVFVLLSYGGWNEAAYISAELQQPRRNMVRSLLWSIGLITVLYLLINLAYLWGLGLEQMASSDAIAADLMGLVFGPTGAKLVSLLIALAALGSLHATLLTGARTNVALGQDFAWLGPLGRWQSRAPVVAYGVQGAIALALVGLGALTRNGFETMVDYTAPVFWFFFLLSGLSLLRLRAQPPDAPHPFRVPGYPVTPLVFCLACGYLLYSSLVYTGGGALVGVGVVGLGGLVLRWGQSVSP